MIVYAIIWKESQYSELSFKCTLHKLKTPENFCNLQLWIPKGAESVPCTYGLGSNVFRISQSHLILGSQVLNPCICILHHPLHLSCLQGGK